MKTQLQFSGKPIFSNYWLLMLFFSFAMGLPVTGWAQSNADLARSYVQSNPQDFGLKTEDVQDLKVTNETYFKAAGLTNVYLQQNYLGIPIHNAILGVHIKDGQVVSTSNRFCMDIRSKAGSAEPVLTQFQALQKAAEQLAYPVPSTLKMMANIGGMQKEVIYERGNLSIEDIPVRLIWVAQEDGSIKLTWEVCFYEPGAQNFWFARIDAATGQMIDRNNLVVHCSFDTHDGQCHSSEHLHLEEDLVVSPLDGSSYRVYKEPVESPIHGGRSLVNTPADPTASPFGWHDTNGANGAEYTITRGNNVHAYLDLDANGVPDPGSEPDGGAGLDFDYPIDLSMAPSTYRPAAVTNLFYWNNYLHDFAYKYGFDEANGNFQVNNYGNGGLGNDDVRAEAQDGGGTNNANFLTLPDGSRPRMQMYVWNYSTPFRDSDLDNGVIAHEYAHGISNRLTGGPGTASCLFNTEQMGEGWSDYYALMTTWTGSASDRGIGTYVLGQPTTGTGIRPTKYSTNMAVNPSTYNTIKTAAVPHGIGYVWCSMLWEVVNELVLKHGSVAGHDKAMHLVNLGMILQPCSPGFVDGRNAILEADKILYNKENTCLIWKAFAKRGLGYSASQGSSSSRSDGVEAFDMSPWCVECPPNVIVNNDVDKCDSYQAFSVPTVSYEPSTRTALNFDAPPDKVQCPDDVVPNTGEYTVMVWAKQNANQTGSFSNIVSQGRCFYIGHNNANPPTMRLGDSWCCSGIPWPTDLQWHHYTLVRTANNAYFYIDGILKGEKGSPIDNPDCNPGDPHNLNVGTIWYGHSEAFNGYIDELQIWNKALDIKAIQCNMNQRMLGNEPGLTGYYDFEDGTGSTILTNKVNNAHNGTLVNMDPATDWIGSAKPATNMNLKNSFNNSCDASGNYPVGMTTVTWTATDQGGYTNTCSFKVTVNDAQAPVITCPSDINVTLEPGECELKVCYTSPSASDNCPPATPAGYTYRTSFGNSYYYSQNALSNFNTANNNAENAGGHLASITSAAEKNAIAASGAGFSWIGGRDTETEGSWKWDNCENFSYTNWCPGEPNGGAGENYLEMEVGGCFNDLNHNQNRFAVLEIEGAKLIRTTGPAQNGTFSVGTTNVKFKATDAAGNSNTCSFKVIVKAGYCGQAIQIYHIDTTMTTAKIKWKDGPNNPCVTGYQLRIRSEISPGVWSSWSGWDDHSGPGNEHMFTGLAPGTFHNYQIRTKCGNATNSKVVNGWFWTIGVPPLKKADVGITDVGGESLKNMEEYGNSMQSIPAVSLIPNPAKDFVSVQIQGFDTRGKELMMFDLMGKLIFRVQLSAAENNPELDLNRLNARSGSYLIRIADQINQKTVQLIVER